MPRKPSCLLALVLLCGVGQSGASADDGTSFIVHLPHGGVELVGITDYPPTLRSQWWQPDGSPAKVGPCRATNSHVPDLRNEAMADAKVLAFLVRFHNLPAGELGTSLSSRNRPAEAAPPSSENRSAYASVPPPEDPLTEGRWPAFQMIPWGLSPAVDYVARVRSGINSQRNGHFAPYYGVVQVVDANGQVVPHCQLYKTAIRASALTADLWVGIDMGPWQTVIHQKPDRAGKQTFDYEGQQFSVTFQKPTAEPSAPSTQVRLATSFPILPCVIQPAWPAGSVKLAQWLVAVAHDGNEHLAWIEGGRAVFPDLPLSSITEFRFQVRAYHWAEFQDVSLHPGQKTNVQLIAPDESAKTEK
jgi:hypothetical protein